MLLADQDNKFGLAPIKQENRCVDYETGLSFDPFAVQFKRYYEENCIKWYHMFITPEMKRTLFEKAYKIWNSALLCNAKATK
jgi:hypothetical protein